ncbi:alpha-L-rhamnosidase-related protein [Duganella hordei]|uniref:alpha-L-rhamnosidase-related protein n=1 Tax=Duganella hordei TaxID=2865934 RepID=UPI0030E99ECD
MRKNIVVMVAGWLALLLSLPSSAAGQATWIWYPGDFEIWLSNQMQVKRVERDALFLPFWRLYSHQPQVNFTRRVDLAAAEEIAVTAEGQYSVAIDGGSVQGDQRLIRVPAGQHVINVQVFNQAAPPAIYVKGATVQSDAGWTVGPTPQYQPPNGVPVHAASWNFDGPDQRPSDYRLATTELPAVALKRSAHATLVDFGRETVGFVKLKGLRGRGKVVLHYGKSLDEALAVDTGETLDSYAVDGKGGDFVADRSRALRYVNVLTDEGITVADISLMYEYLPLRQRGTFNSSDAELNRIWDVAVRTLELNTREFFVDGIKRDRWVWAGDAAQAYLMNYYAFFDRDAVKRTTWALRGADPVDMHINTIMDYSLYWFISIQQYYQYTGDQAFVQSVYPRMVSLMEFVLGRRNKQGMLAGLPGDWVFVDWAPIPKNGELAVIQILLARSLEAMAESAVLAQDAEGAERYRALASGLKDRIMATYWDKDKQLFIHGRNGDQLNPLVTRYPNMFAMMFGYLDAGQLASVKKNVLLNDKVLKITTPYMRFYELAALAESGQQTYVTGQIKDYWGGMLKQGATCFWEQYDPAKTGTEQYAMYGKPFGMSLCHAWGASPVYLLGKYYLGVRPTQPGYAAYVVEPQLGGLKWIEGKVPTPQGDIAVFADERQIKVTAAGGNGVLRFKSRQPPRSADGEIRADGAGGYEMKLESGRTYVVNYAAPVDPVARPKD